MKVMLNGLLEVRSNCSWLKMKIITVVPPCLDIYLHSISSISTHCLICLSNMHPKTLINCLINLKPLFRALFLPMYTLSILLSYQLVVLTLEIREHSSSVVECLTRDRRAAGSSLTGVTALWSLSKTHLS